MEKIGLFLEIGESLVLIAVVIWCYILDKKIKAFKKGGENG